MKNFQYLFVLCLMGAFLAGCGEPSPDSANTNVAPEVEKTDAAAPQGTATQADVRTD